MLHSRQEPDERGSLIRQLDEYARQGEWHTNEGRREGDEGRLADADQHAAEDEGPETQSQAAARHRQRPDAEADADEPERIRISSHGT